MNNQINISPPEKSGKSKGHAYICYLNTPVGSLQIQMTTQAIVRICYATSPPVDEIQTMKRPVLANTVIQEITRYFKQPLTPFTVPLALHGTLFQQRVWQTLRTIPCGQTCSYGDLAHELQTSARAIGNACRANPVPLIIPCHRITAKTDLGGFSGQRQGPMVAIKRYLLTHEAEHCPLGA